MFVVCSQTVSQSRRMTEWQNDKQIKKSGANSFSIFSLLFSVGLIDIQMDAILSHARNCCCCWCIIYFNFTAVFLPFLRYPFFCHWCFKSSSAFACCCCCCWKCAFKNLTVFSPAIINASLTFNLNFFSALKVVFGGYTEKERIGRIGSSRLISFEE